MKTKLICILSLLLLCGCYPSVNQKYKVTSCELRASGVYAIVIMETGDSLKNTSPTNTFRLYSDVPFAVGSNYVLRMEEVK